MCPWVPRAPPGPHSCPKPWKKMNSQSPKAYEFPGDQETTFFLTAVRCRFLIMVKKGFRMCPLGGSADCQKKVPRPQEHEFPLPHLKIQLKQLKIQLQQLKIQLQQRYCTGVSFQRAAAIKGPTGPRALGPGPGASKSNYSS